MYTLSAENQYGERLELTHNPAYGIKSVIGLDPPDGIINTTRNAGQDGSIYNSSYVDNRVITITMAINYPAETNRINLYRFFKTKFPVKLYYNNNLRDVTITGYVQSMQIAFFDKKETCQITILCPDTLFSDVDLGVYDLSGIGSGFEFPFNIDEDGIPFSIVLPMQETNVINHGDIETGALITIAAIGPVINPQVYNVLTGKYMKLNTELSSGDVIMINTRSGQKSIKLTSGGETTSLIGNLTEGSTWLQLTPGDNIMGGGADTGSEYMTVTFQVVSQYQGV